jgi:orotidine-5'-phosphate decarboxylase
VVAFVKVGLELFTAGGPDAVRRVRAPASVFLDLKLHDIPNTVERAARNAGRLGVGLLTVHAQGGPTMVAAAGAGARAGAQEAGVEAPSVIAVTVLSSLAGDGLASPARLASDAVAAGADGVVVSGADVSNVRAAVGPAAILIVPGIRGPGDAAHDQVRILTPADAMARGADYLVVGRPVTEAEDRVAAARAILRDAASGA